MSKIPKLHKCGGQFFWRDNNDKNYNIFLPSSIIIGPNGPISIDDDGKINYNFHHRHRAKKARKIGLFFI